MESIGQRTAELRGNSELIVRDGGGGCLMERLTASGRGPKLPTAGHAEGTRAMG